MNSPNFITLHVQDQTRQREFTARIPTDATWGETMKSIVANMALPKNDPSTETVWEGRLEREGRKVHATELNGDAFLDQDKVVMEPEVNAG